MSDKLSKSMSYLLRHGAQKENISMNPDGFILISDLLEFVNRRKKSKKWNEQDIFRVVETNDKKRFHIENNKIRANQGHSLTNITDLNLEPISTDIKYAIHGTYKKFWSSILIDGLKTMNRNHVHMAESLKAISGMRKSCNLIIYIDIKKATDFGCKFYKSKNNVILTENTIPASCFHAVIDKNNGKRHLPDLYPNVAPF